MTAFVANRWKLASLQATLKLARIRLALKFDPAQPRDERGRWTETNGSTAEEEDASIVPVARRRNRQREAECDAQLEREVFHCRMVGLPSCYAQAQFRYAACLRGDPIPPLSY